MLCGEFFCVAFFLHNDRYRIGNKEVCYDLCSVRMRICGMPVRADIAVRRSAKSTERLRYCDCENLTLKECGSEESVVQRDEMECF